MGLFLTTTANAVKPDPYITMSEWADDNFVLPKGSTKEYGKFRVARTPFIKEPLDELSPQSRARMVVVMKPTQLAGTTLALVFLCCIADLYPGPCLFMQPNEAMAKSFSKKRLTPALESIPTLQGKVRPPKSRDSGNTLLMKEFPGGSYQLKGSNSGSSYRSESEKYVIGDDLDGFERDIGGEGDPVELLDRRTGSFSDSKIYLNSTPTEKETSLIGPAYENTSQGLYSVPCPRCGEYQYLEWGNAGVEYGIKFTRDKKGGITDIWYQCKHCKGRIEEHEKQWMLDRGKYVHQFPDRVESRGFKWNALYTPIGWKNTWKRIAESFLKAAKLAKQGNPEKLKAWTNTLMAELWDEEGTQPDWAKLRDRKEPYPLNWVPEKGLLLTAGVDTQDNRLVVVVRAWGREEESWLVFHDELYGDPIQDEVWSELDKLLNASYPHESGNEIKIASVCIDTGGHRTQAVYNYCRTRFPLVAAIKGADNRPVIGVTPTKVDVTYGGVKIPNGCLLWTVGDNTSKSVIYSRLNIDSMSGPGVYHFHKETSDAYFRQITGEKLLTRYVKGFPVSEWHKTRPNDVLDCEKYAYAAAIRAGMGRPGFWESLELALRPVKKPAPKKERKPFVAPRRQERQREPWVKR